MKHVASALVLLSASATAAGALGLDRSGQDISAIFEPGGFAKLSYGFTRQDLSGYDISGDPMTDAADDFSEADLAVKTDLGGSFSLGLIIDEPYGSDIAYGGDPQTTFLGGTRFGIDSRAITAIGRYRFNDSLSVHGGLQRVTLDGVVAFSGRGFGPLQGYRVDLEDGEGTAWLAGIAYERPENRLRIALTYNSGTEIDAATTEIFADGEFRSRTKFTLPEAWNLDVQTGIGPNTLVFGRIRSAAYSQTQLMPAGLEIGLADLNLADITSITDMDDGRAYELGVSRQFTETFEGLVALTYEPRAGDDFVSALTPVNGLAGLTIGGTYTLNSVELSGTIRYTVFGDARPTVVGLPVGALTSNEALSVGLSVAYRF